MNFLCFVQNQTDTSHFLKLKYSLLVPQNGPCQYRSVSDITSGRFIIRSELWKLPVASAINSAAYRVIVSTSGAITGTLSGHPHSKVHCWKSDSSTLISVFDSVLSIANVTELNRNYTESFQANNYLSEVDHCIKKISNWILNYDYNEVGMFCQMKTKKSFSTYYQWINYQEKIQWWRDGLHCFVCNTFHKHKTANSPFYQPALQHKISACEQQAPNVFSPFKDNRIYQPRSESQSHTSNKAKLPPTKFGTSVSSVPKWVLSNLV